jgi:hypothetical protein
MNVAKACRRVNVVFPGRPAARRVIWRSASRSTGASQPRQARVSRHVGDGGPCRAADGQCLNSGDGRLHDHPACRRDVGVLVGVSVASACGSARLAKDWPPSLSSVASTSSMKARSASTCRVAADSSRPTTTSADLAWRPPRLRNSRSRWPRWLASTVRTASGDPDRAAAMILRKKSSRKPPARGLGSASQRSSSACPSLVIS